MALATGLMLRTLMCERMSGDDGYFDSFELVFFPGDLPPNINSTIYDVPLVVFPLPQEWAIYYPAVGVVMVSARTAAVTAAGVPTYYRFNGIKSGVSTALLQGTVGDMASGADMKFANTGWPVGLPVSIKGLRFYPPQFNN